jgi:uncharacterized membrane protein
MYDAILTIHSLFRWVVLLTALFAIFRFASGWLSKRQYTGADDGARKFFTISLDIQFLLGLILMFVSPIIASLFADFKGGMANSEIRFFGMEHTLLMLVAVVLGHIGGAMAKKPTDDATRFRKGTIFFVLSLVLILVGIPWWRLSA